jgi:hypothetical protein
MAFIKFHLSSLQVFCCSLVTVGSNDAGGFGSLHGQKTGPCVLGICRQTCLKRQHIAMNVAGKRVLPLKKQKQYL